ncbi:ACT domain - like 3, partial [Theobroma cacao]
MDCWSPSLTLDEEFEKLVIRMNPPRVTVDNATSRKATLIKVDSANKRGSLLEVVQVLTDLDLIIRRAYISSDGEWFMDVFHVTDQYGNKLSEVDVAERIQQKPKSSLHQFLLEWESSVLLVARAQLGPRAYSFRSLTRSVGVQAASKHTTIELTGRDRPGLLSEVFAVLTDLKCNVVAAEVWTHNSRMASVVYITDEATGSSIDNPERLTKIKQLLLYVLKGDRDQMRANTAVSVGSTHTERRLHQMMYADRDYDMNDADSGSTSEWSKPLVTVENCADKGYTVVNLRCLDRPKLLFDTVCTLTDMQYVVYHATVIAEGPEAYQEYYIRHMDGCPVNRVGLLSDVTRIFRENGLSVTRAEVTTRGSQAVNAFCVTDASGDPVKSETIEAVRKELGLTILHVKDDAYSKSPPQESGGFSLGTLFKSRSEKFLYNLGLI